METIEVTARFDELGRVTPLHFTWKGTVQRVEATGRQWTDTGGQHILVMVTNGRIYELTFISGDGRWFIRQGEPEHKFV
jgi:hypothetical protein